MLATTISRSYLTATPPPTRMSDVLAHYIATHQDQIDGLQFGEIKLSIEVKDNEIRLLRFNVDETVTGKQLLLTPRAT